MSRLAKTFALAACVAVFALPAMAQTKWNLPAAYPADNPHSVNLIAFAKDVATATGDGKPIGDTWPNTTVGVLVLQTRHRTCCIEPGGWSALSLRHRHATGSFDLTFLLTNQALRLRREQPRVAGYQGVHSRIDMRRPAWPARPDQLLLSED